KRVAEVLEDVREYEMVETQVADLRPHHVDLQHVSLNCSSYTTCSFLNRPSVLLDPPDLVAKLLYLARERTRATPDVEYKRRGPAS
ncbi:MAG TPA: hypothetical protein VIK22_14110, partial [Candidatus Anoxymicrobiaceae bacterium]